MSKDGAPAAEVEDFYAPHITDPDRPQEMMSEAEMKRAARNDLQGESSCASDDSQ